MMEPTYGGFYSNNEAAPPFHSNYIKTQVLDYKIVICTSFPLKPSGAVLKFWIYGFIGI